MDERTLRVLEFDKIKENLLLYHETEAGKRLTENLFPSRDIEEVRAWQNETSEAKELLQREVNLPSLGGMRDLGSVLERAELSSVLAAEELLDLKQTLTVTRLMKQFLTERAGEYVLLGRLAGHLVAFKDLEQEIERTVDYQGEVLDTASPALADLRRQKRNLTVRIREKLEQIIKQAEYQKMFQEALITIRSERYVVPIKQEYKNQFPGLVHDQSASGATLFVEPMVIVNMNNDLRRVVLQEKDEIIKILTKLSLKVGSHTAEIRENLAAAAEIDFILAKGRFSQDIEGISPVLNTHGFLKINRGRHPLLGKKARPTDIHLGRDFRILVITGPNTGGKTVTLKTVGLFTLMTQAGLHIPAGEDSVMAVFQQIYSDIGDEQSIEQSLSTFSSHITYIAEILKKASAKSLILLDELGAGTDPAEGAALAMAILENLYERKSRVIATTHYSELKTFSYSREGIENASVEFNLETLSPTYRLLIGIPGRSNAFAIAGRLGIERQIIEAAEGKLEEADRQIAHALHNLEENRIQAELDRKAIEEEKAEIARLKREFEQKRQKTMNRYEKVLARAYQKAEKIVRSTEGSMKALLEELKKAESEKRLQEKARQAKEEMNRFLGEFGEKGQEKVSRGKGILPEEIKKGLTVYIPRLMQKGEVISLPDQRGEVTVQVGLMKLSVKVSQLEKTEQVKKAERVSNVKKMSLQKVKHISPEIDLRGKLVEEAVDILDKYLDDAEVAGLKQVNIIHGKGTGALRHGIQEYLKVNPLVEDYYLAAPAAGGDGATVVILSK